jgi:nucleotide-binding universal stress UspA family protein
MTYKTVLVSLNEIDRAASLLQFTASLANDYNAHVIGLYVIPAPIVYAAGPYAMPEVVDIMTQYFVDRSKTMRGTFDTEMARNGLSFNWLEVKSILPQVSSTVGEVGRIADIVIVSEIDSNQAIGVETDFVANVIMGVGAPVLILPRNAEARLNVDQIICGYNGSREGSRAIRDALPLLKKANDVRLVWVDPTAVPDLSGPLPGAEMAGSLGRHGVKVTAEAMPTSGIDPAEALLMRARDFGAGLIVMGAYGHSRLREFVLGGATRNALRNMSIPIFMSH